VLLTKWSITVEDSPLFKVIDKVKCLNQTLRERRRQSFDTPGAKVGQIRDHLEKLKEKLGCDPLKFQKEELELQA